MRSAGLLSLAAWLAAACSDGRDDTRGGGSAGDDPGSDAAAPPAQVQSQSFSRGTVPMRIIAKVGGKTYQSSGTGECASSPDASIYEVPATLWHAIYSGGDSEPRQLNLTVWRPKAGGPDMVSLSLQVSETAHQIATVKGGQMAGSGTPGVQAAGSGGTLTVTGKDDHGDAIDLSVQCERFDEVIAEGG
jgi:hypothetical protein